MYLGQSHYKCLLDKQEKVLNKEEVRGERDPSQEHIWKVLQMDQDRKDGAR